jgi:hypothetical protein
LDEHRGAEQRDELAAFQLIELHSILASQGQIVGYRIGEDQSAGNGAILQRVSRADLPEEQISEKDQRPHSLR